jgi:hypothetical protein
VTTLDGDNGVHLYHHIKSGSLVDRGESGSSHRYRTIIIVMSDRDRERDRDRDRGRDRDRDREGEPGTYSSRPSTSEGSYRAQGPIPLFDQHLRLLADSYISFFTERCVLSCHLLCKWLIVCSCYRKRIEEA